jgi:curved DNA-binding protein CbpA
VSLKNYYELLGVLPTAPQDEIKRAFRGQIARYHPDKVQHLGQEFQAMAADRAAELTEAYRILSHEERRGEYDRARESEPNASRAPAATAASATPAAAASSSPEGAPPRPEPPAGPAEPGRSTGPQFTQERASRDTFVRKATMNRFRQALEAVGDGYEEGTAPGLDLAFLPKSKLFGRGKGTRLLGRFVSAVDSGTIVDTWGAAVKWNAANSSDVCVFLMGSSVAPPRELARAIAEQRRKPSKGGKVVLIPVDARNWEASMPTDAPDIAKTLLDRLRSGG